MFILILFYCIYLCLQCCAGSCDVKNTFDCYEPQSTSLLQSNVSFNYDELKVDATWEYLEDGELNFTMDFTNYIETDFDLKLSYIELNKKLPENKTKCEQNGTPYLHSKYTCDNKNLEVSNFLLYTKKKINVLFKYIYTGCYWVTLYFKGRERGKEFSYFWNTTYQKETFNLSEYNVTNYKGKPSDGLNFMISHPILKKFPEMLLTVVDLENTKHLPEFWLQPSKKNDKSLEICDQNLDANKSNLNVKCTWHKEEAKPFIFCQISPIRNNSKRYLIDILFVGDPIKCTSPIWKMQCQTFRNITPSQDEDIVLNNTNHTIVLSSSLVFGGFGFLLTVSIIIIYIYFKNGDNNNCFNSEYPNKNKVIKTRQIILIYARDCPAIMDTLTSFRNLLIIAGYTVEDIFATMEVPIDFNSLSRDVQKSDVKIIVFLNPCGHSILTTQFKENQRWIYEPSTSYREDFFQSSMHILQNPSHSKNILLAKFEFDDLCYNSIRYISSQAIHNLPSDIQSLLQKVGHMQKPPKNVLTDFHEEYLKARSYCECKPRYGYINELMQIHTLVSI